MNPLTNVKNIQKLNEIELKQGLVGKKSWHDQYKDSAWLFIGGLPYDLSEGDVICVFSQYGEIVNINMVRDKQTGKTKGYCFLCYEDQRSTILAVDNLNGAKLLGRTLRVDHVESYKAPKEHGDEDDVTKQLRIEGCAPKVEESSSEEEKEDNYILPLKKHKKEKDHSKKDKKKKKKKDKKKKKEKPKSESESDSSSVEIQTRPIKIEKEGGDFRDIEQKYRDERNRHRHSKQTNSYTVERDEQEISYSRVEDSRKRDAYRDRSRSGHRQTGNDRYMQGLQKSETDYISERYQNNRHHGHVDRNYMDKDRTRDYGRDRQQNENRIGDRNREIDRLRDNDRLSDRDKSNDREKDIRYKERNIPRNDIDKSRERRKENSRER